MTIAAGLLMTLTAATGMKALEIVSTISVPLIVVLGVYSMVTATTDGGGLVAVFAQSAGKISVFDRYWICDWFLYFWGNGNTEFYSVCEE
ncbi:MAG: hypothetical protein ACLTTH_06850 [Holdemanella porci]